MDKGYCSFCDNGNKYDIGEAHGGRLGKAFLCYNCLEELKDLLELSSINREIANLKNSLSSLREDTDYDYSDLDKLTKRVEALEKSI